MKKFPIFVLGFILLFALSTTGVFAPANHYKGKYFGNTVASGFKEEKLLKSAQTDLLTEESIKVQRQDRKPGPAAAHRQWQGDDHRG